MNDSLRPGPRSETGVLNRIGGGLLAGGIVVALVTPSGGIQGRIAGTWLVPR